MESSIYHIPVLLQESMEGLNIKSDGIYVDVTLGGGGHSREILSRLGEGGQLFSFDQDADAIKKVQDDTSTQRKPASWTLIRSNFRYLKNWMRYYGIDYIDGLLADLGVSSHHFDTAERGFSFRVDAPLDMRMNQQSGHSAADVVNTYSAEQLTAVFRFYGELRQAQQIAETIVKERAKDPILRTFQLAEALTPLIGRDREKKDLAKAFQALRIEVNGEMDALRDMLSAATELLRPEGRLVVIAYHSLEDRIVKNLMRSGNLEGHIEQDIFGHTSSPLKPVKKPIVASEEEVTINPRSRSARLRIAEKINA